MLWPKQSQIVPSTGEGRERTTAREVRVDGAEGSSPAFPGTTLDPALDCPHRYSQSACDLLLRNPAPRSRRSSAQIALDCSPAASDVGVQRSYHQLAATHWLGEQQEQEVELAPFRDR